jgi:hypothetical protein
MNTPVAQRALCPGSAETIRALAERERDFDSIDSLRSALRFDPASPLARLMLAGALESQNASERPEERDSNIAKQAAFLRRYDLDHLPADASTWARASAELGKQPGQSALRLEAARKAVALDPDLPFAREGLTAALGQ